MPAERAAVRRTAALRSTIGPVRAVLGALVLIGSLLVSAAPASAAVPDSFAVKGSGFGHGVGMPQYGAYQMAREGFSATSILGHYYTNTAASDRTTPARISVQVFGPDPYGFDGYGDTTDTTTITVQDGWWRLVDDGVQIESGPPGTLRATASNGDVVVEGDGRTFRRDDLTLEWSGTRHWKPTAGDAIVSVAGAHGTYRHGRMFLSAIDGVPNIVNQLRLNSEYLYGIAEMPSSWGATGGQEALRAQAIVARSYAVLKAGDWKPACDCHLVDDVRDQQFSGWKKESEAIYGTYWRAAVNATWTSSRNGRVLTYGGAPVAAHYFSSSGGRTANSEDVWSSVLPYERSVSDPYSARAPGNSYVSWTRVMSQSRARDLFDLGNVKWIKVTDTYSSGQARTLTASSALGVRHTITGKADYIRAIVGRHTYAGSLPAAWISDVVERY
jgi:stage II sporulation protein D